MLPAQQRIEMPLWPNGAPNDNGLTAKDENGDANFLNLVANASASITVYKADKPNGMAIVMCPGGGYWGVALGHEGHDMASWLNAQGITYVVLKYRMPNGHHEIPLNDAEQAMRLVRANAADWGINPRRVGIMGASAGGHLAASLATLYGSQETRPDFQILFYPVISMDAAITHQGSRDNLLGSDRTEELMTLYSNELQVTEDTPPAFIVHAKDDNVVPITNSQMFYDALQAKGVPAELHVYEHGGHGFGLRRTGADSQEWPSALEPWMRKNGFMK